MTSVGDVDFRLHGSNDCSAQFPAAAGHKQPDRDRSRRAREKQGKNARVIDRIVAPTGAAISRAALA